MYVRIYQRAPLSRDYTNKKLKKIIKNDSSSNSTCYIGKNNIFMIHTHFLYSPCVFSYISIPAYIC